MFVGFGAGLRDPNFSALRKWSQAVLASSEYRHFRLALENEVERLREEHAPDERILVLPFGREYADLVSFIDQFRPRADATTENLRVFDEGAVAIDRRLEILELKRATLPVGEYLRELSTIALDLLKLGGTRNAWHLLVSPFLEHAAKLEPTQRVQIGLALAEMMLEDNVGDAAMSVLGELDRDIQSLSSDAAMKLTFWDLQSRGYAKLYAYEQTVEALHQALSLAKDAEVRQRLHAELAEMHLLQGEVQRALDVTPED